MDYTGKLSRVFGIVFGIIGAVMLIPGLILAGVYWGGKNDIDLLISGGVIALLGCIFLLIGLVSLLVWRRQRVKKERLMREGECYDAHIVRVYDNMYMHMNYRHPLIVECGYKDSMGKTYLVKSGNIWLNPLLVKEDTLRAKVYVNPGNPRDYHVEVSADAFNDGNEAAYDYDYR